MSLRLKNRSNYDPTLENLCWYCDNAALCKAWIRVLILLNSRACWALSSIFSDISQIISHQRFETQYLFNENLARLAVYELHALDLFISIVTVTNVVGDEVVSSFGNLHLMSCSFLCQPINHLWVTVRTCLTINIKIDRSIFWISNFELPNLVKN